MTRGGSSSSPTPPAATAGAPVSEPVDARGGGAGGGDEPAQSCIASASAAVSPSAESSILAPCDWFSAATRAAAISVKRCCRRIAARTTSHGDSFGSIAGVVDVGGAKRTPNAGRGATGVRRCGTDGVRRCGTEVDCEAPSLRTFFKFASNSSMSSTILCS